MPADKVVARLITEIVSKLDTSGFDEADKKSDSTAKKIKSNLTAAFSVGALVAFGKKTVEAFNRQEQAVAKVRTGLESMGPVAGKTLDELIADASALQKTSLFSDEEILAGVTSNLLTFGNISGDVFDKAQQAAVDLSARLGQDLQSSAIQLGKALNDPVKGITALSRVGVSFTEQQQDMIKAMVESGDTASAQNLILGELEKQYGGTAAAAAAAGTGGFTQIMNVLSDLSEIVGGLIVEYIGPLANAIGGLINWVNDLSPGLRTIVVGVGALTVAIGGLMLAFGPVGAIVGLVAAGILLLIKNFDKIKQVATIVFNSVRNTIVGALSKVLGVVSKVAGVFDKDWAASIDSVKEKIESYAVETDHAADSSSVLGAETAALERETALLRGETEKATVATGDNTEAQKAAKKAQDDNAESVKALASAYTDIAASLAISEEGFDANQAEARALESRLKDLHKAGRQNTEEFARLSERLDELRTRLDVEEIEQAKVSFGEIPPILLKASDGTEVFTGKMRELDAATIATGKTLEDELNRPALFAGFTDSLDLVIERFTGTGEGSLLYAVETELAGAFVDTLGVSGKIPGVLGSFVDGALADLSVALVEDITGALLGEGGVASIFSSVFGEDGLVSGNIAALIGQAGLIAGAFIAAGELIGVEYDKLFAGLKRGLNGFFALISGGPGGARGQTDPVRSPAETLGGARDMLTEFLRALIASGFSEDAYQRGGINDVLSTVLSNFDPVALATLERAFGGRDGFVNLVRQLLESLFAGGAAPVPTGTPIGGTAAPGRLIAGLTLPVGVSAPMGRAGRSAVPIVNVQIGDEPIESALVRVLRGTG